MLIRINSTFSTVIDYRETAPNNSSLEDFMAEPENLIQGGLSVAVPSQIRGIEMAHKKYGRLPWRDLFQPAIAIARQGFHVTPKLASMISKCSSNILHSPAMRQIYMKKDQIQDGKAWNLIGEVWIPKAVGDLIKREDLATTLERVALEGPDAFYTGEIANAIVKENNANGGKLTLKDMIEYNPIERQPIEATFKGFKLSTCGAPASGSILVQILNVLDRLPLKNATSSFDKHLFIESLKFGYAGRILLGDPKFEDGMLQTEADIFASKTVKSITERIDFDQTHEPDYYTKVYGHAHDGGTTHLSVLDSDGMAVSVTDTVNLEFGAFIMDPITGVIQNNEMGDFSLPGTKNSYGLPPSPSNYVRAGKRPVSSSTPIILEKDGQVVLVTGAAGGSRIISVTAQVIADLLIYKLNPIEAMTRSRFHHQLFPNEIVVDEDADDQTIEDLISKGHKIIRLPPGTALTSLQLILRRKNGKIWALSDPRKGGLADGY